MAKLRENPFRYGNPVSGEHYFPNPPLTGSVRRFLDAGVHVVLVGPRRFGKTSFIRDLLEQEAQAGRACLFIDTFNVTSHRDFLQQLLLALKGERRWLGKAKAWLRGLARRMPGVSVQFDDAGAPSFSFTANRVEAEVKDLIVELLQSIRELGKRIIVAVDEFQSVAELEDKGWLEATLRTQMQQLRGTSFLFSGTRRSIISNMFNNQGRPFYRTCQLVDFPAPDPEFSQWVSRRFALAGARCRPAIVDVLRGLVHDTPNYVQMACFHLVAEAVTEVDERSIRRVLQTLVKQTAYQYQTLMNALTPAQQRALRLCANEKQSIYGRELLARYEIASGPALASSIKALKQKQILDESSVKGTVTFDDPLFEIWLKVEFGSF